MVIKGYYKTCTLVAIQCEQGIRNDLKELHKMVLESKVSGACERKLFDELCQKYVGNHGSSAFLRCVNNND